MRAGGRGGRTISSVRSALLYTRPQGAGARSKPRSMALRQPSRLAPKRRACAPRHSHPSHMRSNLLICTRIVSAWPAPARSVRPAYRQPGLPFEHAHRRNVVPNVVIGVHAAQSAGRAGAELALQGSSSSPHSQYKQVSVAVHSCTPGRPHNTRPWEATQHPSGWGVLHSHTWEGRGARRAHRQQVPEQLLLHVRLAQEGDHEHLLLPHAQARAAIHIAVQVPPGARGHTRRLGQRPCPLSVRACVRQKGCGCRVYTQPARARRAARMQLCSSRRGGRPHAMYAPSTGSTAWTLARTASATPAYTSSNASPGAPPTLPGVSAGSSCAGAYQATGHAVGSAGWLGAQARRAYAQRWAARGLHAMGACQTQQSRLPARCTGLRGRMACARLGSGQDGVGSGAPLRRAGGWWLPGRAHSPPACAPGRTLSAGRRRRALPRCARSGRGLRTRSGAARSRARPLRCSQRRSRCAPGLRGGREPSRRRARWMPCEARGLRAWQRRPLVEAGGHVQARQGLVGDIQLRHRPSKDVPPAVTRAR